MTTLVIVESPVKAKTIKEYLGKDFVVTATRGHIADLAKTGAHNLGVDIEKGFKPRYVLSEDKVSLLNDILKACEIVDDILICSDPDREGEAIAYHVYSRIKGCGKPIKRAVFHEINKRAIQEAISKASDIDMNLVRAQEARRVLDRIVGFMASPYICDAVSQKGLSAGRVQSVLQGLITSREAEIEEFVPEVYWSASAKLTDGDITFESKLNRKISEKEDSKTVAKLLAKGTGVTVTSVVSKEEKKNPPQPLTTNDMLQALIKWYKFPVDKTTKLAQGLFEKGFITYIRTDSPAISPEATEAIRGYLKDNNLPISAKVLKYESKQANAQEAHEAIRVTDVNAHYSETDLSEDERKLYEVIWKHTVACQMAPAIYDTMKVTLQIDGTKETLVSSGKALKSKGYLEILGGGNKAEKIDIPPLKKGDKVSVSTSKVEEKQTQPPPRFNTSELLEFMKKNSIGRPATVPTLLKKVTDRGYVTVVNEVFRPTELGNKVSELLSKNFKFMDIKFTAYMENLLDDIAAGRASYKDTIQKFWDEFTKQLDTAYSNVSTKDDGSPKCPQCGASMVERNGKFGTFWGCSSWKRTGCKGLINIGAAPWEKK